MKTRKRFKRLQEARSVTLFVFMLALFGLVLFALCNSSDAATRYAQSGGSAAGDCGSWGAACDLQYAISQALSGDEIWVKAGIYKPTAGTDRTISFNLKNGVAIYGGFNGTETDRDLRDQQFNVTTLSGDIGINGDASDNSYHVVAGAGLDSSAVLDGFTITAGNANGASQYSNGAGMYNESSSPTLGNITLINNRAGLDGGGIYNSSGSPVLNNIAFINNAAGLQGGGIYNLRSSPVLNDVTFSGNIAGLNGGGIYNLLSSPVLNNVIFSGNSSDMEGVGSYNLICSESVSATATTLISSLNPSTYGEGVQFTGTVTGNGSSGIPTGTVTFTFNNGATTVSTGTLNGTGQATFSTSGLGAGIYTITAVYTGDGSFTESASDPLTQTVNKAGTTTGIASHTPNPSTFGQTVAFTATVSSGAGTPIGTVIFKDGATALGSGALNGTGEATFSTSALGAGIHTITAVYSGDENFSGSTSDPLTQTVNVSPTITSGNSASFSIGINESFTVTATGYPVPSINSSGSLPSGISFTDNNNGTATLGGTPGAGSSGQYELIFTASNGALPDATQNFTIMIANHPPVLDPIGDKTVNEGQPLQFTITASDPDGDALFYDAGNLPTGANFDKDTQTFTWTPSYDQSGSYQKVVFTVTDNGTPMASDFEEITITAGNVNRPPVLDSIGNRQAYDEQLLQFTITASDPDGDALFYDAGNLPAGASFDKNTHTFTWTPDYDQTGSYNVSFSVTDNGTPPLSAREEITITVGNVNRPPVLTPIGDKMVDEEQKLEIIITATDPDGDWLFYDAGNLPEGAVFDQSAQKFSWTPSYDQAGNYPDVLFTVTDNGLPPLSASGAITITVGNVNRPPRLDPIGDKTVNEGQKLEIVITAADPDGGALFYDAGNLPAGASFDKDTQTFTWMPGYGQAGTYQVSFNVSDGELSASETITITVNDVKQVTANVDIDPDTLNLKSRSNKNAFTAYIELPSGYDVGQINVATVTLLVNGFTIAAQFFPTSVGDYDKDNIPDRMVKFERQAVISAIGTGTGNLTLTVTGTLNNGVKFSGSDTIKVINPGK